MHIENINDRAIHALSISSPYYLEYITGLKDDYEATVKRLAPAEPDEKGDYPVCPGEFKCRMVSVDGKLCDSVLQDTGALRNLMARMHKVSARKLFESRGGPYTQVEVDKINAYMRDHILRKDASVTAEFAPTEAVPEPVADSPVHDEIIEQRIGWFAWLFGWPLRWFLAQPDHTVNDVDAAGPKHAKAAETRRQ